jgi:hypothetical protein
MPEFTYRACLERFLVKVRTKDFEGHLLKPFRGCSAHEGHRCEPLCKPGSLASIVVHGIFAYPLYERDRLHRSDGLEENDW